MPSEVIFLNQIPSQNYQPNFADAVGSALFFYDSAQSASSLAVSAETEAIVKGGGIAEAIADALATDFQGDQSLSYLFTESFGVGLEDVPYEGRTESEAKVIASFGLSAQESFSFDFFIKLELTAKEIENPKIEDNLAKSRLGFLVLDTTKEKPKLVDYFGIRQELISSQQIADIQYNEKNVNISKFTPTIDINGNNGKDFVVGEVEGTYQLKKELKNDTNITIVQISESLVEFAGDNLIGNLEDGVIYGTIAQDALKGTNRNDKIYASLGSDQVDGKNGDDIMEGGFGDDVLDGGQGNDKVNGGSDQDFLIGDVGNDTLVGGQGDDILIGGHGSDIMTGGSGSDTFVFNSSDKGSYDDVITDFQIGVDQIEVQGWGKINTVKWLDEMFSEGNISNTPDGVLFNLGDGRNQWTLQLAGLTSDLIRPELFYVV
jgi:serralysin